MNEAIKQNLSAVDRGLICAKNFITDVRECDRQQAALLCVEQAITALTALSEQKAEPVNSYTFLREQNPKPHGWVIDSKFIHAIHDICNENHGWVPCVEEVEVALLALEKYWKSQPAQPVQQAVVPEGWKLVPLIPTVEMIEAPFIGNVEVQSVQHQLRARKAMEEKYEAMLSAAPKPDSTPTNSGEES